MKRQVIYENNTSLPRLGKSEFSTNIVTSKLWKQSKLNISLEQFMQIWKSISTQIVHEVTTNALGVKLPFFTGELKVQYLPYKMNTTDIPISTQIGEVVPQMYMLSKGKVGCVVWERKASRKFNRALDWYAFEESQENFRDVVKRALLKNPEMFRVSRPRAINLRK